MPAICRLCFLLPMAWLAQGATGDDEASKGYLERHRWIMHEYESGDFRAAQRRLRQEWGAADHALLMILNRTDSDETRRLVVERLADMRSEQAVLLLIKQITLEGHGIVDLQEPLTPYPAALALARIGLPAVRAILRDRLHLPASNQELALFAAVVHRHYVVETAVGRFHIRHLLEEAERELEGRKDPDRFFLTWQQNLTKVLQFYDATDRGELKVADLRKLREPREEKRRTENGRKTDGKADITDILDTKNTKRGRESFLP